MSTLWCISKIIRCRPDKRSRYLALSV